MLWVNVFAFVIQAYIAALFAVLFNVFSCHCAMCSVRTGLEVNKYKYKNKITTRMAVLQKKNCCYVLKQYLSLFRLLLHSPRYMILRLFHSFIYGDIFKNVCKTCTAAAAATIRPLLLLPILFLCYSMVQLIVSWMFLFLMVCRHLVKR